MTEEMKPGSGRRIHVSYASENEMAPQDQDSVCSRTNEHDGGSIPLVCARQFQQIEGRLTGIESKLDALISNRTVWAQRLWGVLKAVGLLLAGWVLGNHKGGSGS